MNPSEQQWGNQLKTILKDRNRQASLPPDSWYGWGGREAIGPGEFHGSGES